MKMKQIPLIALGIALVILVSGCVNQQKVTVAPNDGLAIVEFDAEAQSFSNDEPVPLYLNIENQGGTTASNVVAEILGASWVGGPVAESIGTMSPPDLTIKPPVPGQFEIYTPVLDAYSKLPEGVVANIDLTARVSYDYASNGQVTVYVLNKEEYRRRMQTNKEVPATKDVQNSYGPIHIDIDERGLSPIVAESTPGETKEVAVTIYIKNVGSGAPITDDVVGKMSVNLELQGSGAQFEECMGSRTYISGDMTSATLPITLRRGEQYTIPCKVTVSTPTTTDAFSILFRTNYRYFVEQPKTITIIGAPES